MFRYIDVNDSEEVIRAIDLTDPEIPLDLIPSVEYVPLPYRSRR